LEFLKVATEVVIMFVAIGKLCTGTSDDDPGGKPNTFSCRHFASNATSKETVYNYKRLFTRPKESVVLEPGA